MSVKFYLSSGLNKSGEAAIRANFCVGGESYAKSVGISVNPQAWKSGAYKDSLYENAKGLSGEEICKVLQELERRARAMERRIDGRIHKRELRKKVVELLDTLNEPCSPMLPYLDRFIQEQSVICQWTEGTADGFRVLKMHLCAFNPDADLEYFNADGINQWLIYLRSRGLEESTVRKMYQHLRWFLLWAIRNGHTREMGIQRYRPKFKLVPKPVIYLTGKELAKLYALELKADSTLAVVRDGFCLCAFTSLRYSDLAKLRKTDISGKVLWVTTQKTRDRLPIDLNPAAKAILERYSGLDLPGGRAMPVISNQKMNIYIKVLCRMCRIDSPVTKVCYRGGIREEKTYPKWALVGTHAARRSFICFALDSGIPPQVIMKWTGHSDYKSMKPYIDISEKTKASAMRRLASAWDGLSKR